MVFFFVGTAWLRVPPGALVIYQGALSIERVFVFQFFLIKQLVVNSKKIGGSAAGQTKRIEKDRSSLVSF